MKLYLLRNLVQYYIYILYVIQLSDRVYTGLGFIFPEAQPKGIYIVSRECHIIYLV
jgi:hypothetical protein